MDLAARPLSWNGWSCWPADADHAEFEMVCGKGGYVHAIARDLGRALGCLGHVQWLRREWSGLLGRPGLHDRQIEALARTDAIDSLLQPLELGLSGLPELRHAGRRGAAAERQSPARCWATCPMARKPGPAWTGRRWPLAATWAVNCTPPRFRSVRAAGPGA